MDEELVMMKKLDSLKIQHRELDDVIRQLGDTSHSDELYLCRLKKQKLDLRDQIVRIEEVLYPDLIA